MYLDGLYLLNERIAYHNASPTRLFPVAVIAQGLLLTTRTAIVQPIRGVTTCVAGLLTFNQTQIIRGGIDILSAIVQIFVIPFFAVAAAFSKKWANNMLTRLEYNEDLKWDVERVNGMVNFPKLIPAKISAHAITGLLRGVTATPILVTDSIFLGLTKLISYQLDKDSGLVRELLKLPLAIAAPFMGLATACSTSMRGTINELNRLNVDLQ